MTGIELIAKERQEQIEKHNRTIESDLYYNSQEQSGYHPLVAVALYLIDGHFKLTPSHWNDEILDKMVNKPHKERLIIAAALLAAEVDRLQSS